MMQRPPIGSDAQASGLHRAAGGGLEALAPPPLSPGDWVQPIAPAGPCAEEALAAGSALLAAAGLRVRPCWPPPPPSPSAPAPAYLAAADRQRAEALRRALADDAVAVLWAVRGGYGSGRLLSGLDPALVARRPRWLVGFSDITALHGLWARAGVRSLHAANLSNLASWEPPARLALWRELGLDGRPGSAPTAWPARPEVGAGTVRGPLGGGNLTVLASLMGTDAAPRFAGQIVLLEDVNEPPYRLDRAAHQLRAGGALRGALGVAIGQLCGQAAAQRDPLAEAARVAAVVHGLGGGLPIVSGLPVGHAPDARAVVLGRIAALDVARGLFTPDASGLA